MLGDLERENSGWRLVVHDLNLVREHFALEGEPDEVHDSLTARDLKVLLVLCENQLIIFPLSDARVLLRHGSDLFGLIIRFQLRFFFYALEVSLSHREVLALQLMPS